jgi:hypothetical protein
MDRSIVIVRLLRGRRLVVFGRRHCFHFVVGCWLPSTWKSVKSGGAREMEKNMSFVLTEIFK